MPPLVQFSLIGILLRPISENASEIATLQRLIKGIGALKFRCADWVYSEESPMPLWDCVGKAEFWTSGRDINFRSHLSRPCNSFDVAGVEGNAVHLRAVGGTGADAGGAELPLQICLLNPTTIQNAIVIGLPFILTIIELPKG